MAGDDKRGKLHLGGSTPHVRTQRQRTSGGVHEAGAQSDPTDDGKAQEEGRGGSKRLSYTQRR